VKVGLLTELPPPHAERAKRPKGETPTKNLFLRDMCGSLKYVADI